MLNTKTADRKIKIKAMIMKFDLRSRAIVFILIALFAAACGSFAYNSAAQFVSKSADGLAIDGYDAVAYRTIEAASKGKPEYEFVWNGAKWLFLSEENRERFAAAPEFYAPEYGGYCAWSVSEGNVMEADPEVWKIVDGKLYLIQNEKIKEVWEKTQPDFIKTGDQNWRKMQNK